MSTRIGAADVGISGAANYQTDAKRSVLTLSDGSAVAVVVDDSDAGASGGAQDDIPRIRLYHSTDRSTWTLKATRQEATMESGSSISCAVFPDDSIGFVWSSINGSGAYNIGFTKFTYAAGPTYTFAFTEFLNASYNTTDRYRNLDVTVSDTSGILVAAVREDFAGAGGGDNANFELHARIGTNNWYLQTPYASGTNYHRGNDFTVVALGGTNTARRVVFVHVSAWNGNGTSNDEGFKVYSGVWNETTGVIAPMTLRTTLLPGEFNVQTGTVWTSGTHRRVNLFRGAGDSFRIAIVNPNGSNTSSTKKLYVSLGTWDGTTFTNTSPSLKSTGGSADRGAGFSYSIPTGAGAEYISFVLPVTVGSVFALKHWIAKIVGTEVTWTGPYFFDNNEAPTVYNKHASGNGGDRNNTTPYHDMLWARDGSGGADEQFRQHYAKPTRAPASLYAPAAGSTIATSLPQLTALADIDQKYPQTKLKIKWQFATDASFTTNVKNFIQTDSKFALVENTDAAGTTVAFTDYLPSSLLLPQGTWYMRAAHVDEFGNAGAWTASQTFTVSHPPSASPIIPYAGQIAIFGTGAVEFGWIFSDPSPVGDVQTAYQVVVERNDTGATVFDSGKVTTGFNTAIHSISATYKNLSLRWKVRVWDIDDVAGAYSATVNFMLKDAPTVVINSPTNGSTVTSGLVNTTFTPTAYGSANIAYRRVEVTQGGVSVYDTGWQRVTSASGAAINIVSPETVLHNHENYTLVASVRDSDGLEGSATIGFSTEWIPPAAPTGLDVDDTNYNVEGAGYIEVTWDDTNRDEDFIGWPVYRKEDEVDLLGNVLEEGVWTQIDEVILTGTTYSFLDYYAPARKKVHYRVTQKVNRFGDHVESENTNFVTLTPQPEGYWLIEPSDTGVSSTMRLSNVTSDSYEDAYEEVEYTLIGRGRRVDRGDKLGVKGSLSCQFRDGQTTARQKKRALEAIKVENRDLYLRTPFGDVYRVSVGNISVGRVAGVGPHEFVDVNIPYTEVAS